METNIHQDAILLGKYRVERVLGQGGMGVVVAARHIELGGLFAIKFLLPGAELSSDAVSRFVREARASASLRSEHVAKVHDVGRLDGGMPYMVMEHLEGADLGRVLHKSGPLPLEETTTLVLQACDALAEAHALGIVHRDIKPQNLFLTRRRNGKPCLKVLDFGISKQSNARSNALTKSGALLGSPLYMSPEQVDDSRSVDHRSDIWSLGIVLYELTTGKTPFEGDSIGRLLMAILHHDPAPPTSVRPGLPPELDEVVLRCLRKNPEERYASVEELASALRSLRAARSERAQTLAVNALGDSAAVEAMATLDALGVAMTAEAPAPLAPTQPAERAAPEDHVAEQRAEPKEPATPSPASPAASTNGTLSTTVAPAKNERPRWAAVLLGAAGVAALGLGFWVVAHSSGPPPASPAATGAPSAQAAGIESPAPLATTSSAPMVESSGSIPPSVPAPAQSATAAGKGPKPSKPLASAKTGAAAPAQTAKAAVAPTSTTKPREKMW